MKRFKLVLFALRTNIAIFALLALWMFAVQTLTIGYVQSKALMAWGAAGVVICLLQELTVRGLRKQKNWAWLFATLFGLLNIWIGIGCAVMFSRVIDSPILSRQAGVAGFAFYFLLSGAIILFGLYLGKTPEVDDS